MEFIISQILGLVVSIAAIVSMQLKSVRMILVCQLICNGVGAVSYVLVGGFSGCGIYFVALAQTILFFILRQKEIKAPNWLAAFFVAAYLGCSLATYKSPYDIFSAAAAVTCALAIAQENPLLYRVFMLLNGVIWMIYDISAGAYTMIISHMVTALSSIVGIIRIDLMGKCPAGKQKDRGRID